MTDFNDIGLGPEGEGETSGAGPGPAPFDPLFPSWEETSEAGSVFGPPPPWLARRQDPDDFLDWDLPRPATGVSGEFAYPVDTPVWRAAPVYQPHVPPFTEAQQALREGVITIPQPGRRWWVSVREAAETVLLALLVF